MTAVASLIDPDALLLLAAANATPVIFARVLGNRLAAPIDAMFRRHGEPPILGAHKTWRGLITGAAAALLAGSMIPCGAWTGLAFGALSLSGDLASSYVKRRLRRPPGHEVLLVDQLPEALLPLITLAGPLGLTVASIAGTAACFTVLDLITARWRRPAAPFPWPR